MFVLTTQIWRLKYARAQQNNSPWLPLPNIYAQFYETIKPRDKGELPQSMCTPNAGRSLTTHRVRYKAYNWLVTDGPREDTSSSVNCLKVSGSLANEISIKSNHFVVMSANCLPVNCTPWWRHQMETSPRCWPFVRGIHQSRVNSPHKARDAKLWCFLWSAPE